MMHRVAVILLPLLVLTGSQAPAQDAPSGRLIVTVVDQTGAVISGATVRVVSQDDSDRPPRPAVQTTPEGVATITGLLAGQYTIEIEFPGFEPRVVRNVRVRTGDTRQNAVLAIARIEDAVQVGQDPQTAASDRRGPAFGTVLTREQIDALSDDPDELRRQLQDMAGPGAVIRVDSFEGAELPPKSQIRMIRISRDAFAAENHGSGGIMIDIVTQPGIGPLRGSVSMRLREGALTGRSPFVDRKGPERTQQYSVGFGGTIVQERTSFTLNLSGMTAFETPNLNVALPGGRRSEALGVRRPSDNVGVNATLDHAITLDQTLRFGYTRISNSSGNLGIGAFDLPERAYETERSQHTARLQHVGPLGRRFFVNTRVLVSWSESSTRSALEAPTIQVADAFTSGGQQRAGGSRTRTVTFGSDLDYVRGIHSFRTGVAVEGGWYLSDDTTNYLGTYTFESLEAYEAGRPRSYTRRVGDPTIRYVNVQGAFYVQDDIRVRQNLTLSPGVRYEVQTHVRDYNNVGPRVGVTWAPTRSGGLTLRASSGVFYEWLVPNVYEQTLRVDGFRQREITVANPSFPVGDEVEGISPPLSRYLLADDIRLNRQVRFSGGLDRPLSSRLRVGLTYAHTRGTSLQRGRNLNAPVDGFRPDPAFANLIESVSDARSAQHGLSLFFNGTLMRQTGGPGGLPPGIILPGTAGGALVDWRRFSFTGQYTFGSLRNDTDGAFSTPATGDLADEWGPGGGDVRHRVGISMNAQTVRNLTTSVSLQVTSGTPYTIRTGFDENADLIFNDRPSGVARNTERTTGQVSLNGNISYSFAFGRRAASTPPPTGVIITSTGGATVAQTIAVPQAGRFRINVFAQITNLTNRPNYAGYSGVLTSPFFGRPTTVLNPRRVDIGVNFGF
jgi:hypothetical protein